MGPRRHRRAAAGSALVAVLVATAALSACGSDSSGTNGSDEPAGRGLLRDYDIVEPFVSTVQQGIVGIDESRAAACDIERRTLDQAIETFTLLEGRAPLSEAELVPDWLREESALWEIVEGRVVPAADSPC